jgi:hypothetical protein
MNETVCYVERQPGHDPNDKEGCRQNQKEEILAAVRRAPAFELLAVR